MKTRLIAFISAVILLLAAGQSYACYSNQSPVALIGLEGEEFFVDTTVQIFSESYDPDGSIVKEEWDYDEGGGYVEGNFDSHVFSREGIHNVKLRVTDNDGAIAVDTCEIYIGISPNIFYVSKNGDDDNDGTSWENAFLTIQHAIGAVNNYDIIVVGDGVYQEYLDFNGRVCTLKSVDPNNASVVAATIINPNNLTVDAVTYNSSEWEDAVLDGFTITGGRRGIVCDGASPTIKNCVIKNNTYSGGNGGGMYNTVASPSITNCFFTGNSADSGGGIYDVNSDVRMTNCVITGNTAGTNGGGIYNENSSAKLVNCTISSNTADPNSGGGIYNKDSACVITNCIIWGNTGGSIHNDGLSNPGTSNLVGWWKLDEISGTTACDSAGSNNGTVYGDPAWTTGQIGGALSFDGINDYVDVPDNPSLRPSYITMSAWIKPTEININLNK